MGKWQFIIPTVNGLGTYDTDTKTITEIIAEGHSDLVSGEMVIHKIAIYCLSRTPPNLAQLDRFAKAPYIHGFKGYCDIQQWGLARQLAADAVDGETFLQADYDLIDSILPS